jgi:3-hydroxybutyryl-CoA dehydrogenase
MVDAGLASAEDIDTAMVAGCAPDGPAGPGRPDRTRYHCGGRGIDVRNKGQLYAPPALLLRKVEAGDLGPGTGRGFFPISSSPQALPLE